jgi:flagellar hook protein FlgE
MSLFGALASGVSGLGAYSSALGVVSDNISNINTIGYKKTTAQFKTLVTETRSSGSYSPGGVASAPRTLVGQQGLLQASNSPTDLSIDGAGFFVVRADSTQGGQVLFTRAGSFRQDSEGFLQNTAGLYLQGLRLDSQGRAVNDGNVDRLEPINIAGLTGTAEATSNIRIRANLRSSQPLDPLVTSVPYNPAVAASSMAGTNLTPPVGIQPDFSRPIRVFDAQGGSHSLTLAFKKSATPNQWHAEIYATPADDIITAPGLVSGQVASGTIAFNADGSLDLANTTLPDTLNVTYANNAGSLPISLNFGSQDAVDGITLFDSPSTLISSSVDGAVFGNVTGVSIGKDGIVTALFNNGLNRAVYKLPIATFQNPDGLQRVQGNAYSVSDFSGNFSLVDPLTGGGGGISPESLEGSTVDLAEEFTKLITFQRAFSASGKIITTADDMLQELNQIKR